MVVAGVGSGQRARQSTKNVAPQRLPVSAGTDGMPISASIDFP